MQKKNYNSPKLEQMRVEAEMPVICASGGPTPPPASVGGSLANITGW